MNDDAGLARMTPYELVFGPEDMDQRIFPPIVDEADARAVPLDDPERFLNLTRVGGLLREIAGDAGEDQDEDAGEAMRQHGRLLYHAFQFWRHGRSLLVLEPEAARSLADDPPAIVEAPLTVPSPAGYLQLPRNLFWAAPAPGQRPEPADGFFWMLHREADDAPVLRLLLALGLRADRPGLSVVPADGDPRDEAEWAAASPREGGARFQSTMPGGELDRLYSLETTAEVLDLASRCFRLISDRPETLGPQEHTDPARTTAGPGSVPLSALPFRRVRGHG